MLVAAPKTTEEEEHSETWAAIRYARVRNVTVVVLVAAFQKPDPKPLTRWAKSLVFAETVLGPAQAALLLLAIRRKFMR